MDWILDGLAGHDGYALVLLPDGRVTRIGSETGPGPVAGYVAACGCGWVGDLYYPDTDGARGHWDQHHAGPLRNPVRSSRPSSDPLIGTAALGSAGGRAGSDGAGSDGAVRDGAGSDRSEPDGAAEALFLELDDLLAELDQLARTRPADVLDRLRRLELAVDGQLARAVHGARDTGLTWAQIGSRLGMTRQSAHQRFSRPA